jgi:signal peptidase
MIVGQLVGQPILIGFVVTGSMSPTLEPGDGFVALPPAVAGDIEEGDVVTYEATQIQGGGLTTHRVVGETEQGYVTAGDANPFTDQDGPEPPVQESQIVAVAWQFNGEVVRIPRIGAVALAMQGVFGRLSGILSGIPGLSGLAEGNIGSVMIGSGVFLLAYSFVADMFSSGQRNTSRSRSREGVLKASVVLVAILLLIVVPATASMVIPSGTNDITIVSSESPNQDPTVIQRGGFQTVNYNLTNNGYIPQVAIVEPAGPGVDVEQTTFVISPGETGRTTATIYAPDETGVYVRSISERQYTGILPAPIIVALHNIHPAVAIIVIDLYIITIITILFLVAVGMDPIRFRSQGRDIPFKERLRRKLNKWL